MHHVNAVLVAAGIGPVGVQDLMEDDLDDAVTLLDMDLFSAGVCKAERQVAAEPGVDKPAAEEDAAAGERGAAPECPCQVFREFHTLDRGYQSAFAAREDGCFAGTQVVGCRLLGRSVVWFDDEIAVMEPSNDFAGREDHRIE